MCPECVHLEVQFQSEFPVLCITCESGICSTAFEDCFVGNLQFCHRLETNKIRNIAKLFAHLLGTQAISWEVLSAVRITEADTTSATRIFYKCLFQELAEHMGLQALNEHMADPRVRSPYINHVICTQTCTGIHCSDHDYLILCMCE